MMLYVNGQDIKFVTFCILGTPFEPPVRTVKVGPERFLSALQKYLKDNNKRIEDIKKIVCVVGPGSPTSLRGILSIVNTIRFVTDVELIGIKKHRLEKDETVIDRLNQGIIEPVSRGEMLIPIYLTGPRITTSKKDQLRR